MTVAARVKRLEKLARTRCPVCVDWPLEFEFHLIEELIVVAPDGTTLGVGIPGGAERVEREPLAPWLEPCPSCGRCIKWRADEIATEEEPDRGITRFLAVGQ
jgi:hypothetical protein